MAPKVSAESHQVLHERYAQAHDNKVEKLRKQLSGTISPVLRWTVFAVNVLFWFVGLCMILLGIWAFIQKTQNIQSKTVKSILDVITDIAIVIAFLGLIVFLLAFAGCVGVLRQNIPLLKFFRHVLLGILVLQLLVVIGLFVFTAVAIEYISDFIRRTAIVAYRDDIDLQNFVDWIQLSVECCGAGNEGYLDWNFNKYFNCTESNPSIERCSVPFSCCITPNDISEDIINTKCAFQVMNKDTVERSAIIWPYGCVDKMWATVNQQIIYTVIILTVYMVAYCLVIDVIEKLISQIQNFRESWFRLYAKHDSVKNVPIDDLVHREYTKKVAEHTKKTKQQGATTKGTRLQVVSS